MGLYWGCVGAVWGCMGCINSVELCGPTILDAMVPHISIPVGMVLYVGGKVSHGGGRGALMGLSWGSRGALMGLS